MDTTQEHLNFEESRDFSSIINATFTFAVKHFKPLSILFFTYAIIPVLLTGIFSSSINADNIKNMIEMYVKQQVVQTPPQVGNLLLIYLLALLSHTFISGLVFEYLAIYNKYKGSDFPVSEVWHEFLKDLPSFLGFQILLIVIFSAVAGVIAFIAAMLAMSSIIALLVLLIFALIFGIIYLLIPLTMLLMVRTKEQGGFSSTVSRCFQLVKSNWWLTFGIIIIVSLAYSIMAFVFGLPQVIYMAITGLTVVTGGDITGVNHTLFTAFNVISTVGSSWLSMLLYIAIGIHYYSLVEKKDKNTILHRIESIGEEKMNQE